MDLKDIVARMKLRAEDPEYQKQLREAEAAEHNRRQEWRNEVRRRALAATGIPIRVLALLDAGLIDTPPALSARSFLSARSSILFLAGGKGCGKTVAACHALASFIHISDDGYDLPTATNVGRFVKAMDLIRAGTFDEGFWRSLQRTPFLVVDDLGTEPLDDKGWGLANVAALIDGRYDAMAKTIITTNLDLAAFKARYGATDGGRLIDRLRESGEFVQFDGESMRRSNGQG